MGMAASQARFLGLTARKTNTEYEGQQVNQQRTALANQSANLLNQLLTLDVPTPPLATDYSKTEYIFTDPATSEQISIDSIYKNPIGTDNKETWTVSGYSKSSAVRSNVGLIYPTSSDTEFNSSKFEINKNPEDPSKYVISVNGGADMSITGPSRYDALVPSFNEADKDWDDETRPPANKGDYFYKYTNKMTGIEYYIPAGNYEQKQVPAYEREEDGTYKKDADGNKIAIIGDDGNQKNEPAYKQDENGKYINDSKGNKQAEWAKQPLTIEEIMQKAEADGQLFQYSAQSYTKSEEFNDNNAVLKQAGDGTGRYQTLQFYRKSQLDEVTGEVKPGEKPTVVTLTQQTVQDEDGFNQAMDTYNAKKTIYDKTIADINAKTTVIQQQDKNLELHLNQLDTEQQAIQTEMDAVKKVIDKNIEETFKTFA